MATGAAEHGSRAARIDTGEDLGNHQRLTVSTESTPGIPEADAPLHVTAIGVVDLLRTGVSCLLDARHAYLRCGTHSP